jgi:hypothetical protein
MSKVWKYFDSLLALTTIGTDKVSLGSSQKMGSSSIGQLPRLKDSRLKEFKKFLLYEEIPEYFKEFEGLTISRYGDGYEVDGKYIDRDETNTDIYDSETVENSLESHLVGDNVLGKLDSQIVVVLLRDALDKWKSGYFQCFYRSSNINMGDSWGIDTIPGSFWQKALVVMGTEDENDKTTQNFTTFVGHETELEIFCEMHDVNTDKEWMWESEARFWKWNMMGYARNSLLDLSKHKSIYFLELKELDNPKFLDWLVEKDEKWNAVREVFEGRIPHINKRLSNWETFIEIIWREYQEDKILKGKTLCCPFYDLPGNKFFPKFEVLNQRVKEEQETIDFIRENHERYIRL